MTKLESGRKSDRIVKNKSILEKVKFKGKVITRERLEKVWSIPEIITNDIGFQLMFGFDAPKSIPRKEVNGFKEYFSDKYYNNNY
tara:strand:- start:154 stop:408 length:255 start_codon:yes stop_codon:yes gene_type:complete